MRTVIEKNWVNLLERVSEGNEEKQLIGTVHPLSRGVESLSSKWDRHPPNCCAVESPSLQLSWNSVASPKPLDRWCTVKGYTESHPRRRPHCIRFAYRNLTVNCERNTKEIKNSNQTHEESEWISEWLELRSSGNDEGSSRVIFMLGNSLMLCPNPASMSSSGETEPISSSDDSSIPWSWLGQSRLELMRLFVNDQLITIHTFLDEWLGVAWVVFSFSPSAFKLESECRWTPQLNWSIPSSSWDSSSYSRKSKSLKTPNCWSVVTESSNLESPDRSCWVETSSIDDAMLDCRSSNSELWLKITYEERKRKHKRWIVPGRRSEWWSTKREWSERWALRCRAGSWWQMSICSLSF